MKKIILSIILTCVISFGLQAQITVSHSTVNTNKKIVAVYDSTKNFLGNENVTAYIGQILYVNGQRDTSLGYHGFYTEKNGDFQKIYGTRTEEFSIRTKYKDLYGKYFLVKDVQKDEKKYSSNYWFLLQNQSDTTDRVWYEYESNWPYSYPFITLGYYDYIKKQHIGKTYVFSYQIDKENNLITEGIGRKDFITGEDIKTEINHYWVCVDLTINDENYWLYLVFKDEQGQTVIKHVDDFNISDQDAFTFFEKTKYLNLCEKYGEDIMNKVRQNKIYLGMPENLVIMSWGKPKNINKSSYGPDQWCYDDQYIYIENGKVTAWN